MCGKRISTLCAPPTREPSNRFSDSLARSCKKEDAKTTLHNYGHAVGDSQRRAADSFSHLELANPDIAKARRFSVILQGQRQLLSMGRIRRTLSVRCWTSEFDVVVDRHAIMKNRDASGTKQLAIFRESRAVKYDVEALPLAGRAIPTKTKPTPTAKPRPFTGSTLRS